MNDEIKVTVASYGAGRNLVMRYTDPVSGKRIARTTGTTNRGEANKTAGVWQDELNSGRYVATSKTTWAEFRQRYGDEKLSTMPESSQNSYDVALDHFERIINPNRMARLSPQVMSLFQSKARKDGMKPSTLHRHLRHIKAALNWAERQSLIRKAPSIEMPKVNEGGKHRPITAEEYDRIIEVIPKVRKDDAPAWERLIRGLWLSGLRLGEAVVLDWEEGPFVLDTLGKYPVFRIEAAGQKSRKLEVCPVAPDFAEWILAETPKAERVGRVFPIIDADTGKNLGERQIGKMVRAIGRKAGVVVANYERTVTRDGKRVVEEYRACAGAHDYRRAFCSRWAKKVRTPVLLRLARHGNIRTTMTFYVDHGADEINADLWADHGNTKSENTSQNESGNTFGNTGRKSTSRKKVKNAANACVVREKVKRRRPDSNRG